MNTAPPAKKSDLGVRTLSAIVMLAVAGGALWLGGWFWTAFVALVAFGVWFEWSTLVLLFKPPGTGRMAWRLWGIVYCGAAAAMLIALRSPLNNIADGISAVLLVVGAVIATDIGAYFAGRMIGGPKIAPSISPSKTWAGLFGGAVGSGLSLVLLSSFSGNPAAVTILPAYLLAGAVIAIIAQVGDFFESWMKRRAGVKDSGNLIPGHGGLFDRVDGLLAVCFVLGVLFMVSRLWGGM